MPGYLFNKKSKLVTTKSNPANKDFFSRVYEVTKRIPYGRVSSYGAIGRYLGSGQSARMVGWALNNCHNRKDFIPAHRVVNREGMLTGAHHFGTASAMGQMLENEGIRVEDNRVVDFKKLFWDPNTEGRKKLGKR
jgi:methylated-DNA-protein-cysteine methyltransferase related protein